MERSRRSRALRCSQPVFLAPFPCDWRSLRGLAASPLSATNAFMHHVRRLLLTLAARLIPRCTLCARRCRWSGRSSARRPPTSARVRAHSHTHAQPPSPLLVCTHAPVPAPVRVRCCARSAAPSPILVHRALRSPPVFAHHLSAVGAPCSQERCAAAGLVPARRHGPDGQPRRQLVPGTPTPAFPARPFVLPSHCCRLSACAVFLLALCAGASGVVLAVGRGIACQVACSAVVRFTWRSRSFDCDCARAFRLACWPLDTSSCCCAAAVRLLASRTCCSCFMLALFSLVRSHRRAPLSPARSLNTRRSNRCAGVASKQANRWTLSRRRNGTCFFVCVGFPRIFCASVFAVQLRRVCVLLLVAISKEYRYWAMSLNPRRRHCANLDAICRDMPQPSLTSPKSSGAVARWHRVSHGLVLEANALPRRPLGRRQRRSPRARQSQQPQRRQRKQRQHRRSLGGRSLLCTRTSNK